METELQKSASVSSHHNLQCTNKILKNTEHSSDDANCFAMESLMHQLRADAVAVELDIERIPSLAHLGTEKLERDYHIRVRDPWPLRFVVVSVVDLTMLD